MSSAVETQGTTLAINSTLIGEIVDFSGPGGSASVIDVTHLTSTAKEKLVGLQDEGQFSFSLNLVPDDAGQVALRTARTNRTKDDYTLTLSDDTILTFEGYCLEFAIAGAVDDKVSATATIEITGPVAWA